VLNQVYGVLVVLELDVLPADSLPYVLFLFHVEHLLVEHLLQLFVCVVYAQLLERILLEYLEAKNVK